MNSATRKFQIIGIAFVLALFVTTGMYSCGGGSSSKSKSLPDETASNSDTDDPTPAMTKIVGVDQDRYFIDEKGNRFFPWGLNYTNTPATGMIDDQLQSDTVWHIIEEDFAEMKGLTANAVRIHLQYNRFMLDPWTPDPRAFDALDRLVDIAEKNRLYLIITGLGAYRKADSPLWYDSLSVKERWNTQALFWRTVAGRVGNRAAVFAYDLMNEPVVSVCKEVVPCDWLVGEPFGGYYYVQNISLEPGQPSDKIMAAWIHKLTQAIRSEDSRTLITVGTLPARPLVFYADHLDFVSPHIYPHPENMQTLIDYVLSGAKNRPLVVGEFFNLLCSPEKLGELLSAIEGNYHGLFGHYRGQTPDELAAEDDVHAMIWRDFLLFFTANNPNMQEVLR